MSASLVRKGLELFSGDLATESGSGSSKKKPSALLATTNKTGLKKLRRRENKKKNGSGALLTVKGKKYKSALDEYNKQKPKDNTKDAIKFLNLLSSKKTSTKVVEQVSEYQQRRSVKKVEQEQQKKKQEEAKSCFSEEDFARFEREYFVGPRRR